MPYIRITILFLLISISSAFADNTLVITSPDENIVFRLSAGQGGLIYTVSYKDHTLIQDSRLSITFKNSGQFGWNLKLGRPTFKKIEENYDLIVGRSGHVHSSSNEVMVPLIEVAGMKREMDLEIRIFDDGAAFRYVMPAGMDGDNIEITDEADYFAMLGNPDALVLFRQNYTTSHEGLYDHLSVQKIKNDTLMDMPALFEFPGNIYMAITEANLLDYAGMYLIKHNGVIRSSLSPLPNQKDIKVRAKLPFNTPWRVMEISDRVGTFLESNILTNLSEPCRIKDLSWIKPGKTTFPWWNGTVTPDTTWKPGNNYETNMYYVDFCAKYGLGYHSVVEYGGHEC